MENYGKVIVGYSTKDQKELNVVDYLQASFIHGRLITIAGIEDDSILIRVENPGSTGRSNQQAWVSKESFVGILTTGMLYLSSKGIDIKELLSSAANETVDYSYSDNLNNPIKP